MNGDLDLLAMFRAMLARWKAEDEALRTRRVQSQGSTE
jgi:hypothetical protein